MAAERPAVLAIFNETHRMLAMAPAVLDAIYSDPPTTVRAWQAFMALLQVPGGPPASALPAISAAMRQIDRKALQTWRAQLGDAPAADDAA